MDSVPFNMDLGMSTIQGVLRLEPAGVAVELREFILLDAPKGDLQSISAPYDLLADAVYGKRVGGRLVVTVKEASAFRSLPLPAGAITRLIVRVKRRDREAAALWAAEAALRVVQADGTGE